jgi:cytochrome c oxidase accessory protein FixG
LLSTLNDDGSRRWLRPRPSRGRYLLARRMVAWVLILVFGVLPFIFINGRPAMLLNIVHREFTFFGATFYPTDTLLLALFLLSVFVAIFLVTALYGRVWCGWGCPQTVYLEFVFRPLERLLDGVPNRYGRLTRPPSGARVAAKYAVFFVISVLLANLFLAYFVGVEELSRWVRRSPLDHPGPFLVMAVTTALMMFDFCWFREQTCIIACPYGRLQSVLFDKQTLIVGYDAKRGEPRGRLGGQPPATALADEPSAQPGSAQAGQGRLAAKGGDCVDCGLCVVTCPTGIDIRNGLQLECVGCTQCIDACDAVMDKIHRPRGLIRYGSQAEFEASGKPRFRIRVLVYYALLAVLLGAFLTTLLTSQSVDVSVTRGLGLPFTELPDGKVSNALRLKVTNRARETRSFRVELTSPPGGQLVLAENPLTIPGGDSRTEGVTVVFPFHAPEAGACDVKLRITDGAEFSKEVTYRLLGPLRNANP